MAAGETRHETFTYTISDGKGGTDTATLDIEIVGLNDGPIAADDTYATVDSAGFPGGTPISGNVLANDSDPDAGATLVVSGLAAGTPGGTPAGNVGGSGVASTLGTLTLNADGTFSYNVNVTNPTVSSLLRGNSLTDTFTYTISDGKGGFDTATVTFTIHGTNNAPSAGNDANLISEDQPVASGNVISGFRTTGSGISGTISAAADIDPDADPLTVTEIRHPDPALPSGAIGAPYAGDYGAITLNTNGSYTYTLDNTSVAVQALKVGETRTELFIYTVNDGRGSFVDATITIVVTGVNDAPVALADTNSIVEDSTVAATGNVLTNDSDIDHQATRTVTGVVAGAASAAPSGNVTSSVAGTYGDLMLRADGSYSFALKNASPAVQALAAGATATDTFTYAITDDQGATAFTTLIITIHGQNDAPVAIPDLLGINVGVVSVSGDLTPGTSGQDRDVDGDPINVIGFANANGVSGMPGAGSTLGTALPGLYGRLQVAADGSHVYTVDNANPAVILLKAGESITETYTYTISDGKGGFATSTLTITINGRNDPPLAVNDGVLVTNEDAPLSNIPVLANDTDPDGDPLTVISASSPNGAVTINSDGTLNFTPAANFFGPTTISYTISDGQGGASTATVSITVNSINDLPIAVNDTSSLLANAASVSGNALGNDSDSDTSDTLTVSAVNGVAGNVNGTVTGTYGSITVNANGSYIFTPNTTTAKALAAGQMATDVFTYTISDGHGGTATATITINLTGTNDVPDAKADSNTITEDQTTASGNVLSGAQVTGAGTSSTIVGSVDTDPDTTDTLAVTGLQTAAGVAGAIGIQLTGTYGAVTLRADGSYRYELNTSSPTVQALAAGETRHETFTYTISDGKGGTDTATLDIEIVGLNDGPIAADDTYATVDSAGLPGGTPISGNVLANDSDPDAGAALVISGLAAGTPGGTPAGNVGGTGVAGTFGTLTLNADGTFSYNVDVVNNSTVRNLLKGQSLTDTYTYTISDGKGGFDTATVTFTIHGTNNAPSAGNDSNVISEDQPVASGNVISGFFTAGSGASGTVSAAADIDPDADPLTVTEIRHPDPALPSGAIGAPYAGDYGAITLNTNGSYTYTLDNTSVAVQALKAGETRTELFIYTVNDGRGSFVDATITIVVTGVNDAPVAAPDVNTITEDSTIAATGNVLPNDTDVDHNATKTVSGVVAGASGSAPAGSVATGVTGTYGTLTLKADGSYRYALDNNKQAVQALAAGTTATDTFTYAITDDQGVTAYTTLNITIHGQNDAPVAVADTASINVGGTTANGDLTPGTGAQDSDVEGDAITVIGFANANGASGTPGSGSVPGAALPGLYGSLQVAADGSHIYTINNSNPAVVLLKAGESVTETYNYTISDGNGGLATSTLSITINGRNDLSAANDSATTNEDTAVTASVAGNDSTTSGGVLTYAKTTNPTHGSVVVNADGSYTYTPASNYSGADSFTYTVTDAASGESLTRTVNLTVTPVSDTPTLSASASGNEDTAIPLSITPALTDTDGSETLAIQISGLPVGAVLTNTAGDTLTITAGSITLTPAQLAGLKLTPPTNFNGNIALTVTAIATDGSAAPANTSTTLNVTVNPVDDPATITGKDTGIVIEDSSPQTLSKSGQLVVSDIDAGEAFFVAGNAIASPGSLGTLTITASGEWTFSVANAAVQYLKFGERKLETFTVRSIDGTTHTITVTVIGLPEAIPQFARSGYNPYAPVVSRLGAAETGFVPALHVLPAVGDAQDQTSGAVDSINIQSQSIGAGLGMDISLFVLPAVGGVNADNKAVTDSINGAMARSISPDAGSSLLGVDAVVGDSANAAGASAQAQGPAQVATLDSAAEETAPIARKSFAQQLNLAALNRQLGKVAQPLTRASVEAQRIAAKTTHSKPADRSAA